MHHAIKILIATIAGIFQFFLLLLNYRFLNLYLNIGLTQIADWSHLMIRICLYAFMILEFIFAAGVASLIAGILVGRFWSADFLVGILMGLTVIILSLTLKLFSLIAFRPLAISYPLYALFLIGMSVVSVSIGQKLRKAVVI